MAVGKSVRMFLVDGTPGGLVTAEIMNWTGHAVTAPRSQLREIQDREEGGRTGVYILLGEDPDAFAGHKVYIGEADDVGKRVGIHARSEEKGGKDFWDRVVILTSKDMNLTKAHVRHLESRFLQIARDAKRAEITNTTAPSPLPLPEADVSDMEHFIQQAQIVLPVLGVTLFRTDTTSQAGQASPDSSELRMSGEFELRVRKHDILASADEVDGEFLVLKDSEASNASTNPTGPGYSKLRSKLETDGVLKPNSAGTHMFFTQDYAFSSPSAAAAVVLGRATANGRQEWKHKASGTSYAEWQDRDLKLALDEDEGQ